MKVIDRIRRLSVNWCLIGDIVTSFYSYRYFPIYIPLGILFLAQVYSPNNPTSRRDPDRIIYFEWMKGILFI